MEDGNNLPGSAPTQVVGCDSGPRGGVFSSLNVFKFQKCFKFNTALVTTKLPWGGRRPVWRWNILYMWSRGRLTGNLQYSLMVVLPFLLVTDVMIHRGAELFFMIKPALLGRDGGLSHSCIKKQPRILLANWNSVYYSWKPGHCCWCQEANCHNRVILPCLSSEKMARFGSHFVTSNLNGVFSSVWFWVEENQTSMCRAGQWICSRAKLNLYYLLVSDSLHQPPS